MKTILFTIGLCLISTLSFTQLLLPENDYAEKKNSFTVDYSTRFGVGIKYDRQLLKKGKYSLIGQVGAGANPFFLRRGSSGASVNFNANLLHRFTFNEHSIEAGLGVRTGYLYLPEINREITGINEWTTTPNLHFGYLYQPKNKPWFLRANLDIFHGRGLGIQKDLSVGFGIKF